MNKIGAYIGNEKYQEHVLDVRTGIWLSKDIHVFRVHCQ